MSVFDELSRHLLPAVRRTRRRRYVTTVDWSDFEQAASEAAAGALRLLKLSPALQGFATTLILDALRPVVAAILEAERLGRNANYGDLSTVLSIVALKLTQATEHTMPDNLGATCPLSEGYALISWQDGSPSCSDCGEPLSVAIAYSILSHRVQPVFGIARRTPHEEPQEAVAAACKDAAREVAEALRRPEIASSIAEFATPQLHPVISSMVRKDALGEVVLFDELHLALFAVAQMCATL